MSITDWYAALERWKELQDILKNLNAEEKSLREQLFTASFSNPTEGVNTTELPDGRKLKGTHKINRSVIMDKLGKVHEKLGADAFTALFKTKYELVISAYRQLSDKDRKVVDAALDIKPGLPSLELVPAKPQAKVGEKP